MRETDTIQILLRPDGTLLFGVLTPELLEIASVLNPHDEGLARRLELLREQRRETEPMKESSIDEAQGPDP